VEKAHIQEIRKERRKEYIKMEKYKIGTGKK
jgi:hypothetical protein